MPLHPLDKPITKAAIQYVESHWPVKAYGWRPVGSVPGSLHPKGLALDAMTSDIAIGNAIAAWGVAQPAAVEVIWQRRIWTPSRGWHGYTGPSPHVDHVHIGFRDTGGEGLSSVPGVSEVSGLVSAVNNWLKWLPGGPAPDASETAALRSGLLRIGMVLGGLVLLIIAAGALLRPIIQPAVKTAKKLGG